MDAIFSCLALFLSLVLTKLFLTNKKKKKKNLPPSPPNSLPILGHLHLLKKPLHQSLAGLSGRHGPILFLRFGMRPALIVSSASLANECFTTNDIAFAAMTFATYNYTSLTFAKYGSDWREMRRIATVEALSSNRLSFFADVRANEARALARHLFHCSGRVELRSSLFALAMNIVMRIIAGKRYYGEEDEKDKDAQKFKEVIEKMFSLFGPTNIGDFLPTMIGWIAWRGVVRKMARLHKYRDEIIQSLLEERRKRGRRKKKGI